MRRRWQQGPVRRAGGWTAQAVVQDLELAAAVADVLQEAEPSSDVTVVSADELLYEFPSQDRERILSQLNSRSVSEIQRDLDLRRRALDRLGGKLERRSGVDRRSGLDRRSASTSRPSASERRSGPDRRSGRDRRTRTAA